MEEQITIANLQNELEEVNQKLEQLEGKLAKESAVRERAEHDLQRALTAPEGTKQAHLESEEHYKLLLESTYDVVYAVTTEGIMTYLSPQISLFGYVPEELISNNFIEFVAPEQHQEVLHKFKTGTAAGESFPTQFQWINKDGSRTWVEVVGKTMFDEAGIPVQQIGVIRDITQQKDLEEQLRLSEEKYRVLVEKSHDVVYAVDVDGIISYISPQMSQYGYTPEDIIGKPVLQFIAPEDREKNWRRFQVLVATGSSEPVRLRWLNKDGTIAWVEVVANTVYDDSGQPIQRVGIMRNINYQIKIEDQLRQSEEKYRNLVEQINEVIYSIDLEGKISYISPAIEPFLGYNHAEVIGQPFVKFIVADDLPSARDSFGQLSTGAIPGPQEYRSLTKSGQTRWMQTSSHPVVQDDQVVGVQGVLTDITDRKLAEMHLKREAATAERERLARDLHDSVTQTLYSVAAIAEALPRIWERNQEQARRGLGDLTTLTLAALAEMRTLVLELRPGALEKQSLAELLHQLARGLAGRTSMPIDLNIDEEDCSVPAEVQIALYRITQEALNNIVKHARASQAEVRLACDAGQVKLIVADNGVGFNPQSVTSHRLGLDIMRERAQYIGAAFEIDSQPDIGTQISVLWQEKQEG